jgi:hypothetical protein
MTHPPETGARQRSHGAWFLVSIRELLGAGPRSPEPRGRRSRRPRGLRSRWSGRTPLAPTPGAPALPEADGEGAVVAAWEMA